METKNLKRAALELCDYEIPIFPIRPRDKRPITKDWQKVATSDKSEINFRWNQNPKANIGIPTGPISGLVVIDVDVDEEKQIYGSESIREWEKEHGDFPETWTAKTGRGGTHYYFKAPENCPGPATHILDCVDFRGDGGLIVAPPSIHENDNRYEWEIGPDDIEVAECNQSVLDLIELVRCGNKSKSKKTGDGEERKKFRVPEVITQGQRNHTLTQLAGSLWAQGIDKDSIRGVLVNTNNSKCVPPVGEDEIDSIVESIGSYEQGRLRVVGESGELVANCPTAIDYSPKGLILRTQKNYVTMMQYDVNLYGRIKMNLLSESAHIIGPVPWDLDNIDRRWRNSDYSQLLLYCEINYGLNEEKLMLKAFDVVCDQKENQYNPVVDELEICYKRWKVSGEKHGCIRKLLPIYLGADDSDYNYEVMKLVMLGAICRAFYHGCKFDYMMVLAGDQGIGKSTFVRFLALRDEWCNDNLNTIDGERGFEKIRGKWIAEMAELLATKKAKEVESIKSFITSTSDTYREPYQRIASEHLRSCIFIGTTNSEEFLNDATGNRRFLPVKCVSKNRKLSVVSDSDQFAEDVRMAWGEAMQLFYDANQKPKLVLPECVDNELANTQSLYEQSDPRVGIIQEWLNNADRDLVCAALIAEEALEMSKRDINKGISTQINQIMTTKITGWNKVGTKSGKRRVMGYGNCVAFERTDG